ncbi:unnamed protein product, partial [Gadus morhua 'NCC']
EGEYFLKVLIPSYAAGSIIGKGGQTIVQLQKETGATIKLSKSKDFYPARHGSSTAPRLRFSACSANNPATHLVVRCPEGGGGSIIPFPDLSSTTRWSVVGRSCYPVDRAWPDAVSAVVAAAAGQ